MPKNFSMHAVPLVEPQTGLITRTIALIVIFFPLSVLGFLVSIDYGTNQLQTIAETQRCESYIAGLGTSLDSVVLGDIGTGGELSIARRPALCVWSGSTSRATSTSTATLAKTPVWYLLWTASYAIPLVLLAVFLAIAKRILYRLTPPAVVAS